MSKADRACNLAQQNDVSFFLACFWSNLASVVMLPPSSLLLFDVPGLASHGRNRKSSALTRKLRSATGMPTAVQVCQPSETKVKKKSTKQECTTAACAFSCPALLSQRQLSSRTVTNTEASLYRKAIFRFPRREGPPRRGFYLLKSVHKKYSTAAQSRHILRR